MYIQRALENQVLHLSEQFKIIYISGPARCGKTTMLQHLIADEATRDIHRQFISLAMLTDRMAARRDPESFLKHYSLPLAIDGIQHAPQLLPYLKQMIDANDTPGLLWISGNHPIDSLKGAWGSLADSAVQLELTGLSHAELMGYKSEPFDPSREYFISRVTHAKQIDAHDVFINIFKGSMPGVQTLEHDDLEASLNLYIETYLYRDIRDIIRVTDMNKFRSFLIACAAFTAKPLNYSELARQAEIDIKTAKQWLSALESCHLIKLVPAYANKLLKRIGKQPLLHFMDCGLAAHLVGYLDVTTLERSAYSGQIFETYVFQEMYKSFTQAGRKAPLYFLRTLDKKEIDLVLAQEGKVYPIEIRLAAEPQTDASKNFVQLHPLNADHSSNNPYARELGMGTVVALSKNTYPLQENVWIFPIWAV